MEKSRLFSNFGNYEIQGKLPLAELTGFNRVLIENHTGVLAYSQEVITVKVSCGSLQINGQNMMLAEMSREQLVITGQIEGVQVHRR